MRNTECSFTVNSFRTVVQKQMNSYETKILFSCKYPSVIKYQGNKNDRKMYDVQAEVFPKQCIFHEASIALYTVSHVSNKVQSKIRLRMSSAMEKALILLVVLLFNCNFCAEAVCSSHVLRKGKGFSLCVVGEHGLGEHLEEGPKL